MKNEKEKSNEEEEKANKNNIIKNQIPIPKYKSFNDKKANKENKVENDLSNISLDEKILSLIFFKKYKPLKILGAGTFSIVYEGINKIDNSKVALKIENKNSKVCLLKEEAISIFNLQGYGIIKFISFGHSKDYNILVEPLLGKSLYALYLESKKSFTIKDICLISLQCLDRIEYIHSKGYIHGDIKPENFLIGLNDPRIIYIIDFGLSKKYRSDRTGNHIQFCITKKMFGTARYASTNSLRGVQISRRDDLESLFYMILYFIMKKLPWQGVKANSQQNRYKKIYYMKKKLSENEFFKELPIEIQNFYKSIKKLNFEEEPDYILLKGYLKDLLKNNNYIEDKNFSWINDKSFLETKIETNLRKRKSNSLKRLMDKLTKNNSTSKDRINEENRINPINLYKKNSIKKNLTIKNDFIYSSNNKEIKSINEAIIDVGDFSDNEEEDKIKKLLKKNSKGIKSNNSDIKHKELINKEINGDNIIMKEFNRNINSFINRINENENDNENIKYNKNHEIKKYTSFNQRNTITRNEANKNLGKENKNDYYRCNIGKNYIINENKINLNCKNNNNIEGKNKDIEINFENINQNKKVYKSVPKKLNKRSKSGEKCLIQ